MKIFFKSLLLPLARLALRSGVRLPEIIDSLKAALYHAACEQLEANGEEITASRISTMSGIHRKDATQFLKGSAPARLPNSPAIKVIGTWQAKKKYLTPSGRPRALSIGNEVSEFADLVREVSSDVHPYSILKELERLQLVAIDGSSVKLLRSSYISSFDDVETAALLSRDSNDLLCAVEENVLSEGSRPNHHTSTEYDNIPPEYAKEIQRWIIQEAGAFHKKVRLHIAQYDRDLSEKKLKDKNQGRLRFVFASFSRTETLERTGNE